MKYLFVILILCSYQVNSCEFNLKNPPSGLTSLVNFKYKSELEKDAYVKTIKLFISQGKDPYEYFTTDFYFNNDKGHLILSVIHHSSFCIKGVAGNPSGKDGRLTYDAKSQKIISFLYYQ